MRPQILAVVPARGGSRGVAGKNLRLVGGRTLLRRAVETARASAHVLRIVVSTDDDSIAAEAASAGAEVIHRPQELSTDTASSEGVLLHALDALDTSEGYRPELLVLIQCTSPFTTARDVDDAVGLLLRTSADVAFAATPFHGFLWRQDASGTWRGVNHDASQRPRRQDRAPEFLETGSFYVMRAGGFRAARHRFFGTIVPVLIPNARALEIDEPEDLRRAELLLPLAEGRHAGSLPDSPAALVMDFDGVFTDNRLLVFEDGSEAVRCHRGDGLGLARLRATGLPMLVLSTERSPVVAARCAKLGLECQHGVEDKLSALTRWLEGRDLRADGVIYLGNDSNDIECMRRVGCAVAPSDAETEARAEADIVLQRPGGRGAIRELADLLLDKGERENA